MYSAVFVEVGVPASMALNGLTIQRWSVVFAIHVTAAMLIDVALLCCSTQGVEHIGLCQEVLKLRYLAEPVDCTNAILAGRGHWLLIKSYVDEWLVEH